jgi:hypothetical protein
MLKTHSFMFDVDIFRIKFLRTKNWCFFLVRFVNFGLVYFVSTYAFKIKFSVIKVYFLFTRLCPSVGGTQNLNFQLLI